MNATKTPAELVNQAAACACYCTASQDELVDYCNEVRKCLLRVDTKPAIALAAIIAIGLEQADSHYSYANLAVWCGSIKLGWI